MDLHRIDVMIYRVEVFAEAMPTQSDQRGGQNPGLPAQAASVRAGSPGRVLRPK